MRAQVDWVRSLDEVGVIYELRASGESSQIARGTGGRKGRRILKAGLQNASRSAVKKFQAIFCRTDSAYAAEHAGKVLLRFETAGHCDVQNAPLGSAQH